MAVFKGQKGQRGWGRVHKEEGVLKGGCRDGQGLIRWAPWVMGGHRTFIEH